MGVQQWHLPTIISADPRWLTSIESDLSVHGRRHSSSRPIHPRHCLGPRHHPSCSSAVHHRWVRMPLSMIRHIIHPSLRCVFVSMCRSADEYQRINPTSQVSLFSSCQEQCSGLMGVEWNMYQGHPLHLLANQTSASVQWQLLNQTDAFDQIWFFGNVIHLSLLQ